MKNYFSSRISIQQIKDYVGDVPGLRIQRLNGLSVSDARISTFPAQGYPNTRNFQGTKLDITMNVDTANNYTGATYIQDPAITQTGVSIPPVGTIGYFPKDHVPDGWMEIGDPLVYYAYKRQIGGTIPNPIYSNTEYTPIFSLLDQWGFVMSTSNAAVGKVFNTYDPFRGYFIRGLNPDTTGPDANGVIFSTANSYISLHSHDGDSLYDSSISGGSIDRGYRVFIEEFPLFSGRVLPYNANNTFGNDFWFNYKWEVGIGWDLNHLEGGGTIKANSTNYSVSPLKYVVGFDAHIHGRIKTYYRGHDTLHGKISPLVDQDIGYVPNPKYYRDTSFVGIGEMTSNSSVASFLYKAKEELTYYNPYTSAALGTWTVFTKWTSVINDTPWNFTSVSGGAGGAYTLYTMYTTKQNSTSRVTVRSVNSRFTLHWAGTMTSFPYTDYVTYTRATSYGSTSYYTNTQIPTKKTSAWDTLKARFTLGTEFIFTRTSRLDKKYFPYHILKSNPGTISGDEFYNSGNNGIFIETTSEAGNHEHTYVHSKTHYRGHGETRPQNVALRMCIKY